MSISDLPWWDRPGFKLTREGAEKLTNSELLSIIFWANNKKDDILGISNKILKKYNLNKIEGAGYNELVSLICNGEKAEYKDFVKVMKLLSLIELSKRYNKLVTGGYTRKAIVSAKQVYHMFADDLRSLKKERLYVILLNTKNIPIKVNMVSEGTLNSSLIHPREVFKDAIKESANSIILVHNHPSGDPEPSEEDIEITKKLVNVGEEVGIKVLDHVIIGKEYWSWRERN